MPNISKGNTLQTNGELRKHDIKDVQLFTGRPSGLRINHTSQINKDSRPLSVFTLTFYSSSPTAGGEDELVLLPILRHPERRTFITA
jgi:hypothetical protein